MVGQGWKPRDDILAVLGLLDAWHTSEPCAHDTQATLTRTTLPSPSPPRSRVFLVPLTGMSISMLPPLGSTETEPFGAGTVGWVCSGSSAAVAGLTKVSGWMALRCRLALGKDTPFSSEWFLCRRRGLRDEEMEGVSDA